MGSITNLVGKSENPVSLYLVKADAFDGWLSDQSPETQNWVSAAGFKAKSGAALLLPDGDGNASTAVACHDDASDIWTWSAIAEKLPAADYQLQTNDVNADDLALGWALAAYRFDRYLKDEPTARAQLVWPASCNQTSVEASYSAIALTRDLVNTPAADMGPAELAASAKTLSDAHGGTYREVVGDDLLVEN